MELLSKSRGVLKTYLVAIHLSAFMRTESWGRTTAKKRGITVIHFGIIQMSLYYCRTKNRMVTRGRGVGYSHFDVWNVPTVRMITRWLMMISGERKIKYNWFFSLSLQSMLPDTVAFCSWFILFRMRRRRQSFFYRYYDLERTL